MGAPTKEREVPQDYTQTEKEEQEIAEACNRLIKNSIICWNYLYLARQIEKAPDTESKENLLRLIAAHSPMSWAHINMLGEYDFSEEKLRDTLGILPPKRPRKISAKTGGIKNRKTL
ncbi:MAG: Tn3 family transposase [Opitutales bacterium]|nr:Tn3 family transposase [Opitutales bacterium]